MKEVLNVFTVFVLLLGLVLKIKVAQSDVIM